MLKKCLKYDLSAVWRYWWIIALATLGMSLACGFSIRLMELFSAGDESVAIIEFPLALTIIFCMFGIIGSFLFTMILVYVRFFKHFYSDEGYLTFTLPVKRSTLLASKTINASIWYAAHFAVLFVGIVIILVVGFPTDVVEMFTLESSDGVASTDESLIEIFLLLVIIPIENLILSALTMLLEIVLAQFCITLGAVIARKAKAIVGIGVYYGANAVMLFVGQFVAIIVMLGTMGGAIKMLAGVSEWQFLSIAAVLLALLCVIIAVLVSALYLITLNLIERKLNLS